MRTCEIAKLFLTATVFIFKNAYYVCIKTDFENMVNISLRPITL